MKFNFLVLSIICLSGISNGQQDLVQAVQGWVSPDVSYRRLGKNIDTISIKNPTSNQLYLDSIFFSPEFLPDQWVFKHIITIKGQEYEIKMLKHQGEIPRGVFTPYGYIFDMDPIHIQPDETIKIEHFESPILIPAGYPTPSPGGTLLLVFRDGDLDLNLNTDKFFTETVYIKRNPANGNTSLQPMQKKSGKMNEMNKGEFNSLGQRDGKRESIEVRFTE